MKKLSLQLALLIAGLGLVTPLLAIDINHVHPVPGTGRILTTDFGYVGPHLEFSAQLFSHYMYQPLKEYTLSGGTLSDRVDHRFDLEFSISLALWHHVQIAFVLPVTAYQSGEVSLFDMKGYELPRTPYSTGGLDDLRLFLKAIFWENTTRAKPSQISGGIGMTAEFAVPVISNNNYYAQGSVEGWSILVDGGGFSFVRSIPEATAQAKIVGHLQYQQFQVAFNLGFITQSQVGSGQSVSSGSRKLGFGLTYGVGAQYQVWEQLKDARLSVFSEITGFALSSGDTDKLFPIINLPAEFILGAKGIFWNQLTAFAGISAGFTQGFGAAAFRAFLGIGWTYAPKEKLPSTPPPIVIVQEKRVEVPAIQVLGNKINIPLKTFSNLNQDHPQDSDLKILDAIALLIQARPDLKKIRIEGHTDDIGSQKYNLDLSRRRAEFVRVYLIGKGVQADRLTTEGFGMKCPLVPNDSAESQAKNRRVEFVIVEQEGQPINTAKCTDSIRSAS